ncbi:hypothetical protein ACQZV8_09220 [Magnetococcales bacterium HHB-1]
MEGSNPYNVMQGVYQLQVSYSSLEDRILLRINTHDEMMFQFWLTRYIVKRFWPLLMQALGKTAPPQGALPFEAAEAQQMKARQQQLSSFQHQAAIEQADFKQNFKKGRVHKILGDAPLLVHTCVLRPKQEKGWKMQLRSQDGKGVEVMLGMELLHSFCHLLAKTANQVDWGLHLNLEGAHVVPPMTTRQIH